MSGLVFAGNEPEFHTIVGTIGQQVNVSCRLPAWPFQTPTGFASIYEYDRVLGGSFSAVLKALAAFYGDDSVAFACLDPDWRYYRDGYAMLPAFVVDAGTLDKNYARGLRHEPNRDPTGALAFSANVIAITGTSRTWSIWGQRDWEIALLLTPDASGPWSSAEVPTFVGDVDIETIRSPTGWSMPLSQPDLQAFQNNVRSRGSG